MVIKGANIPIGGFFPEEPVSALFEINSLFDNSIALKSGRSSFNFLIQYLNVKKIYIPFYICEVMFAPIKQNEVAYEYYGIDQSFTPIFEKHLNEGEFILYINYFGINESKVQELDKKYKNQLIVDNTQAFFANSKLSCYNFNSARKFFGVSDGSFLHIKNYLDNNIAIKEQLDNPNNAHLVHLKQGKRDQAFKEYQKAESKMNAAIERISPYSASLLKRINLKEVKRKRISNFNFLANKLENLNELNIQIVKDSVPFAYPFLAKKKISRDRLISKGVFFPKLWPNVLEESTMGFSFEKKLAEHMFPLAIDQRWDLHDMKYIVSSIKEEV